MRVIPLLLLLFAMPLTAMNDVTEQVRCREIAFSQSAEERDAARFATFIDADARFVGAGISRGVDEVVAAWSPFFQDDGPSIKWRPQYIEVLEDGNLALSRGPYRMLARGEDGEEREHWGTFNSVWRRQPDGNWQVVFDAGNAASAPPAPEVQQLLDQDLECGGQVQPGG